MHTTVTTPADFAQFQQTLRPLLTQTGTQHIAAYHFFEITPRDLPWQSSGLHLQAGQSVTFLLAGHWYLVEALNLTLEAGFVFWARTHSDEPMYSPPSNTGTHTFAHSGELLLARSAGEWASNHGDLLVPPEVYMQASGYLYGVAIVWQSDALAGLQALHQHGDVQHLIADEILRLQHAVTPPEEWSYYPLLGNRATFHACEHQHGVCCHTENNVGILQYPVDAPLTPATRLDWRWIIERLPSAVAEDTLPTHDYLSIAVEFDDGQDITYLWSAELPVETVFRCPIPSWTARETHVVVRTGLAALGQAQTESRDVYADYHTHIQGNATRIVSVWLIAVSLFQHSLGSCRYESIVLHNTTSNIAVIPAAI